MRRGTRLITCTLSVALTVATVGMGTAKALTSTTQPQLTLNRLIQTSPFVGSTTKVSDNEGSAYVASDDAFWMADDNGDAVYEVDRTTGALRRKVAQSAFINAPRFGVGGTAGQSRTEDLEALAYDANADVIYAFSGSTSAIPTVFRLTRDANHQFQVQSWQPLPSEWTGAGWRSADGLLYVVNGGTFRTYDFATNTFGPTFSISGLSKVYGMDFDDATGDLLAVNSSQRLYRVSMATKTFLPGWNGISLTGFGLLDTRAVEVIGEQVFVTDGADTNKRSSSSPMFHAVFVFDVTGPGGPGPTASFTATPTTGTAPLTVNFTDTSTGSPTSWSWNFGDGGSSTSPSPSHTYAAGTFTATLTATNALGFSSASKTITVNQPTASFTATPTTGTAPFTVGFTDTSTGSPTSWAWDFGDGGTSTAQSPSYEYGTAGTFVATLTVTYAQGSSSASKTITVNQPSAPTASFTASSTAGTAPLTVNFTDTSTGSPTSWAWDFGDGGSSTSQSPPPHTYNSNGTFIATLTATNAHGSTSASKTITVSSTAVITPSDDTQINLSGTAVPGSAPSFSADGSPVSDGLLKFNVNVGGQITGAKLRVYCVDASSAGGTFYAAAETNPPWSENTVTWATAPVAGTSYGSLGAVKVGFWYEVDLTALVTANGTYSLRIKNTSTNGADYATKEGAAGFAPQLVVTTA